MCSGTTSPGSATIPSGNRGNSLTALLTRPSLGRTDRRLARAQQQVVEQPWRQQRLEQTFIEALQRQVAVERVLAPEHRHIGGVRARLQRAVEPSEPVRQQL